MTICWACRSREGSVSGWTENEIPVCLCERCDMNWKIDASHDRAIREEE